MNSIINKNSIQSIAKVHSRRASFKISLIASVLLIAISSWGIFFHYTDKNSSTIENLKGHLSQLTQVNDYLEVERQFSSILSRNEIIGLWLYANKSNEVLIKKLNQNINIEENKKSIWFSFDNLSIVIKNKKSLTTDIVLYYYFIIPFTPFIVLLIFTLFLFIFSHYLITKEFFVFSNNLSEFPRSIANLFKTKNFVNEFKRSNNTYIHNIWNNETIEILKNKSNNIEEFLIIMELLTKVQEWESMKIELEKKEALSELAQQVSHDTQSAIETAITIVESIDNKTLLNERSILLKSLNLIKDISNDVRRKNVLSNEIKSQKILLDSLLEYIVSSKRIEFKQTNIQINYDQSASDINLFALGKRSDFERILSNVINNAKQAVMEDQGQIDLKVTSSAGFSLIEVKDNGIGISPEDMDQIFIKSFTKNKSDGQGLGLYDAKKRINSLGGDIIVESKLSVGTTVTIKIPTCSNPMWHVKDIDLDPYTKFALLDDENTFNSLLKDKLGIRSIQHISNENELSDWMTEFDSEDTFYFVDFELNGFNNNGVDIIRKFGLTHRSILVSNQGDNPEIQAWAEELGIKLIPKRLIKMLNLKTKSNYSSTKIILLDDDSFFCEASIGSAKKLGMDIATFNCSKSLLSNLDRFNKNDIFLIDFNIDKQNKINGYEVVDTLKLHGFDRLYVVSGYRESDLPFNKNVVKHLPKKLPEKLLSTYI